MKNREIAMALLRSRLLDREIQRVQAERAAHRKSQVGTGDRSEKVRTYNYPKTASRTTASPSHATICPVSWTETFSTSWRSGPGTRPRAWRNSGELIAHGREVRPR